MLLMAVNVLLLLRLLVLLLLLLLLGVGRAIGVGHRSGCRCSRSGHIKVVWPERRRPMAAVLFAVLMGGSKEVLQSLCGIVGHQGLLLMLL